MGKTPILWGLPSVFPPVFFTPPVTNVMLLYSTLTCKKTARAPGGMKNLRGGGQNRIDSKNSVARLLKTFGYNSLLSEHLIIFQYLKTDCINAPLLSWPML